MRRIDGNGLMLPDVADRCDEGDIAAVADRVVGDVTHLLDKQVGGVEFESLRGLVPKVNVVLRIRNHGQGEAVVCTPGRSGPGEQQNQKR